MRFNYLTVATTVSTLLLVGEAFAAPNIAPTSGLLDRGLRARIEAHEREMLAEAAKVAEAIRAGVPATQADMEVAALYDEFRNLRVRGDSNKLKLKMRERGMTVVPRVWFDVFVSLAQVDRAIAGDTAFLAKPNNNKDNQDFVQERLKKLKEIRQHVAGLVEHAIKEKIRLGDPLSTTHFNGESMSSIESRAHQANGRLEKAGKVYDAARKPFADAMSAVQDLSSRRSRNSDRDKLHATIEDAIPQSDLTAPANGDYSIAAVHFRKSSFGGYGQLTGGQETRLRHLDYYAFVSQPTTAMNERIAKWQQEHNFGWCLGSDGTSPQYQQGSVEIVALYNGFEKRRAAQILGEMMTRASRAGLRRTNIGWTGPLHRVSVDFLIPKGAEELPPCK